MEDKTKEDIPQQGNQILSFLKDVVKKVFSAGFIAAVGATWFFVSVVTKFSRMLYPLDYISEDLLVNPLRPHWKTGDNLRLLVTLSPQPGCDSVDGGVVMWDTDVMMGDDINEKYIYNFTEQDAPSLWKNIQNENKRTSIFVNYCLANKDKRSNVLSSSTQVIHTARLPRWARERWLLQDIGMGHISGQPSYRTDPYPDIYAENNKLFCNQIAFRIVSSGELFPSTVGLVGIHQHLKLAVPNQKLYLPPAHTVAKNLQDEGYHVINGSMSVMPITLEIRSSELPKWLLGNHFDITVSKLSDQGMEDPMMAQMMSSLADTSIPLLTVTMFATVLHILLEFLAFKSDVAFWRKNTSLRGLSIRALFIEVVFKVIIFLYLLDEEAMQIILVPSGIAIFVDLWKIRKGTGFAFTTTSPYYRLARIEEEENSEDEITKASLDTDKIVIQYIVKGVFPIFISFSVYSLVYCRFQNWFSWVIQTLAGLTYSAGFLLMTPQVIINYKLKSVAHLPWDVLTYRFVNTFIDDLFAFIVTLPSMHQMSVFRDDIIFIVCVVQRFVYRVDEKRKED